jgi:lipopolysaccharide cholinephosphotransferase
MQQLSLKEIQKIEAEILCEFAALCSKEHLYYTLAFGTLIGSVRHNGFIPWDDDIDVMMPRPDYENLLQNQEIKIYLHSKNLDLISHQTDKEYRLAFAKIYRMDTRLKENDFQEYKYGVYIDIFPVDGVNNSKVFQGFRDFAIRRINGVSETNSKTKFNDRTLVKRILRCAYRKVIAKISPNICAVYSDRIAAQKTFYDSEYVDSLVTGKNHYGRKMLRVNYLKNIPVYFCGEEYNAPSCYAKYLFDIYGDISILPPSDKRIGHIEYAYLRDETEE